MRLGLLLLTGHSRIEPMQDQRLNWVRVLVFAFFVAVAPLAEGQSVGFVVKDPEAKSDLAPDLTQRVAICFLSQTATAPRWNDSRYLIVDPGKAEMAIVDRIEGHTLQLAELTVRNNRFVLAYYFAGGNQHAVAVYVFVNDRLEKLREQPLSSNMRSITIEGTAVVIKNTDSDSHGDRIVTTDRYELLEALKRGFR